MKTPLRLVVLALAGWLFVPAAAEEEPPVPPQRTPSLYVFGMGPVYWPGVRDLDPSGSPFTDEIGRFHAWGVSLEFAYQRRVARRGGADVLFGADVGIFANESSGDFDVLVLPSGGTLDGEEVSQGFFLTPGFRVVLGGGRRWRHLLGAGAGYYLVEFTELLDAYFDADPLLRESTLGAYASWGADYRLSVKRPSPWRLRFEAKVHFVDFGSADDLAPGAGRLDGPIHTLLVGGVWDR